MKQNRGRIFIGTVVVLTALGFSQVRAGIVFERSQSAPYTFTERYPHWTWGSMVGTESNRTAAPRIVSASPTGAPDIKILTIPGAATIVVESASRTPAGGLAVCGAAYESTGKAAGFLGLLGPGEADFRIIRLYPYFPYALAVAGDGSVWTSGDEMIDSNPNATGIDPKLATLRHFDSLGKLVQGMVPRDSLQSAFSASYGFIEAAQGRIGWYTGPFSGPGSVYYEVTQDGTLTKYPGIDLRQHERVTGIALASNGRTYATTFEKPQKGGTGIPHFFSIGAGEAGWKPETLSKELGEKPSIHLYGANGNELVLWRNFRGETLIFARAE